MQATGAGLQRFSLPSGEHASHRTPSRSAEIVVGAANTSKR